MMRPLYRFEEEETLALMPKSIIKKVQTRIKLVEKGIERVEEASEMKYPLYYIEPILPLMQSKLEVGKSGALFARTIPITTANNELKIIIQLSAALVVFGLTGTIEGVMAHEFLHYVEYAKKFSSGNITSHETSTSVYQSMYSDRCHLVNPKSVFNNRTLINLINRKFETGLMDEKLNRKTEEKWIKKKLPHKYVRPEDNTNAISPTSIFNYKITDHNLKDKLKEMEKIEFKRAQRE